MIKNAKIAAIEDDTNVSGVVQALLKEWLAGRKTGNRCRSKRKLFCCSPKAYISGQTKQAASVTSDWIGSLKPLEWCHHGREPTGKSCAPRHPPGLAGWSDRISEGYEPDCLRQL